MKASANREQFLFLVTGGIILVLILLVVIFNMVRSPGDLIAEKEVQPVPKVKVGDRTPEEGKSPWLTQVAPAAVFNTESQSKTDGKVEIDAKDLTAQDQNAQHPEKTQEAWNPKEASALESARLDSRPLTREGGLPPARTPPAPLSSPGDGRNAPPAPKMDGTAGRNVPPPPQMGAQDLHAGDAMAALASSPKRQTKGQKNPQDDAESEDGPDPDQNTPRVSETPPTGTYSVQVASFNDTEHANALITKINGILIDGKKTPAYMNSQKTGNKTVYRVRMGPFPSQAKAQQAANQARSKINVKGAMAVVGPAP